MNSRRHYQHGSICSVYYATVQAKSAVVALAVSVELSGIVESYK